MIEFRNSPIEAFFVGMVSLTAVAALGMGIWQAYRNPMAVLTVAAAVLGALALLAVFTLVGELVIRFVVGRFGRGDSQP